MRVDMLSFLSLSCLLWLVFGLVAVAEAGLGR